MRIVTVSLAVALIVGCQQSVGPEKTQEADAARGNLAGNGNAPRGPLIRDLQQELKSNPNLIVLDLTKIEGSDPITASMSAYNTQRHRIVLLNLQHQIDIMNNMSREGDTPSYEEFLELLEQLEVPPERMLLPLPPHRFYAYDASEGRLVVVEDPARRRN